jgi:hypothetical protein
VAHWVECEWCAGDGRVECEACLGLGTKLWQEEGNLEDGLEIIDEDLTPCAVCFGDATLDCDDCEGTGGWYSE